MSDVPSLVAEITERLSQAADPARLEWAKENYPTAMQVLGVKVPDMRPVVIDLSKRLRPAPAEQVIALAQALADTDIFECRKVGYEILSRHKTAMATLDTEAIERLGRGNDNWIAVDTLAGLVAGPIWREGQIPDEVVRNWTVSEDRWWRRTAVVCTVALNQKARGGAGDPERTLDICGRVAGEQDPMMAKALSWALRELAKRDPAPVQVFLAEHDDVLPALVKREVRRKIETGRK